MNKAMLVSGNFRQHIDLANECNEGFSHALCTISQIISVSLKNGSTLFLCGNGGSSSDSQHLAAELIGRFSINRVPLRAISLTTDSSVITCIANDFSYDDIFSRQLEGLANPGDILLAISTSGNSTNIIRALEMAKTKKLSTVAFLGGDGGVARDIVDYPLIVPSKVTARIQEMHILFGHILCELLENDLGLV